MRLLGESFAGRVRGLALTLILVPALAACGSHHELASAGAGPAPVNGPAADYPIVIGSPYKVGETLYTPADRMNFDEVGYVAADSGRGVTASHHTLAAAQLRRSYLAQERAVPFSCGSNAAVRWTATK